MQEVQIRGCVFQTDRDKEVVVLGSVIHSFPRASLEPAGHDNLMPLCCTLQESKLYALDRFFLQHHLQWGLIA